MILHGLGLGGFLITVMAGVFTAVPDIVERPFAGDAAWPQAPVELPPTRMPGGAQLRTLHLFQAAKDELLAHRSMQLVLGTYDVQPQLIRAELWVVGTSCRYVSMPGAT